MMSSSDSDRRASRVERILAQAFLSLLALGVTFGALEIGARVFLSRWASPDKFLCYASFDQLQSRMAETGVRTKRFSPHVYLGHVPSPNYSYPPNSHNSLGFRGPEVICPKPPGRFRIVCLGGSTAYGDGVEDPAEAYPAQLETLLRKEGFDVDVVNAGVPSYTTWETLGNLAFRCLDLDPDLAIVYDGINDVTARFVWPAEAYRADGSGARICNRRAQRMVPLLQHSTLARMILIRMGRIPSHNDLDWSIVDRPATHHEDEFTLQRRTGTYPSGLFAEVSAMDMLNTDSPVYFERNLRSLMGVASAHDIDLVLMTFAVCPKFTNPRASSDEYVSALAHQNSLLKGLDEVLGVRIYDMASAMSLDSKYFTDGVHCNAEGYALFASLVANYLKDSNLIPLPR